MRWLSRHSVYYLTLPLNPFADSSARSLGATMLAEKGGLARYLACLAAGPGALSRDWVRLATARRAFFRDPAVFEFLERQVIPRLAAHAEVRVWCAGCAHGEEPYSLSILFVEALGPAVTRVRIIATDRNDEALATAAAGNYSGAVLDNVSAPRLARHFTRQGSEYSVNAEIRQPCRFSLSDLLGDQPPEGPFQMILIRNVIGWLVDKSQRLPLFQRVHAALQPGGFAVFGKSEPIEVPRDLFELAGPAELRVYRKR